MKQKNNLLSLTQFKQAYQHIARFKPITDNSVLDLALVRDHLYQHYGRDTVFARQQAAIDILTEFVLTKLTALRSHYDIETLDTTRPKAIANIREDGATGNVHLASCSLIYYRYLRAELELSVAEITELLGYSAGHLRRSIRAYWKDLHQSFTRREMLVRTDYQQWLTSLSIPAFSGVRLETQDEFIERLANRFQFQNVTALLIVGNPGAGKTTVSIQLAQQLAKQSKLNHALWYDFHHGDQATLIASIVREVLGDSEVTEDSVSKLRNVLAHRQSKGHHVLVVLDHVTGHEREIARLWPLLSHLWVIATADATWVDWAGAIAQVPTLTPEDVHRLLSFWHQTDMIGSADSRHYWETHGANPSKLKESVLLNA